MRRSFTALMAVMLLAALAPSAAFAKPPDYQVKDITVVAGPPDSVGCRVYVNVMFRQPEVSEAGYMLAVQYKDGAVNSTPPTLISRAIPVAPDGEPEGVAWGTQDRYEIEVYDNWRGFRQVRLDTDSTWQWGAQLFSGSFTGANAPLSKLELTSTFTGGTGSCPAPGTVIASH
jgi:hypothetical protein